MNGGLVPDASIARNGMPRKAALDKLRHDLAPDVNARKNLATFSQTFLEQDLRLLMQGSIEKNGADRESYPASAGLEDCCVRMLANLWNAAGGNAGGCATLGSSEAALLAGLALKWDWRRRRRLAGRSADRPNLVVGASHVCWSKFSRYFDVELRQIPVTRARPGMSAEDVLDRVDENTIGVIATFGVTATGHYEPVAEVAEALDRLAERTGLDIPIHVDAASGGFVAPFVRPDLSWDFRLPRVTSINASGHKFGLAPLGVGWLIWRDESWLSKDLIFEFSYLGGSFSSFSLNFSRPSGPIACQYYLFLRLGHAGYRRIHQECYEVAQYLRQEIGRFPRFEILHAGEGGLGIPAVSWTLRNGGESDHSLVELSCQLQKAGWKLPAYPIATDSPVKVMRLVVRRGFTREKADLFLDDLRLAYARLGDGQTLVPAADSYLALPVSLPRRATV